MPAPLPEKATHQQTKAFNSQLVLKAIYDHGQISRAALARMTSLTRATVSELVDELLDQGLVQEIGRGPSAGGKSPILLGVVDDARHIIAIDLASEVFTGAIMDLRGRVCYRTQRAFAGQDSQTTLDLVNNLADELVAAANRPLLGIGLGTPGLVDTTNGVVLRAVNLDWQDLPLAKLLADRYNLPVYIANDSQLTALAQYIFGDGPKISNLIAIKLGHGIGAGIVLNGQLFQGDGFGAGEIGHVNVLQDGPLCRCGNRGCLEAVASERAITRRVQALRPNFPESILSAQPEEINSDEVFRAYQAGDGLATQVILEAGRYLGIASANLVGALNLRHIWLVGRETRYGQPWLDVIRQEMSSRSLATLAELTQIEVSSLNDDVVLLGASALLLTRELGLNLAR